MPKEMFYVLHKDGDYEAFNNRNGAEAYVLERVHEDGDDKSSFVVIRGHECSLTVVPPTYVFHAGKVSISE